MRLLFLPLWSIVLLILNIYSTVSDCSIFEKIAQENLKSLTQVSVGEFNELREARTYDRTLSEVLTHELERQSKLRSDEKRRFVFSLLIDRERELIDRKQVLTSNVLDYATWQDLHLLSGPLSCPSTYLAALLDRTHTEVGKAAFFRRIVQPTADLQQLQDNQAILKELLRDTELFHKLDQALKDLRESENILISLWKEDTLDSMAKNKGIKIPFVKDGPPVLRDFYDDLHKNDIVMEVVERMEEAKEVVLTGSAFASAVALTVLGCAYLARYTSYAEYLESIAYNNLGVSSVVGLYTILGCSTFLLKQLFSKNMVVKGIDSIVISHNYGFDSYFALEQLKVSFTTMLCLQAKLIHIAKFFNAMHAISLLIMNNDVLFSLVKSIEPLLYVLKVLPVELPDVQKLLDLLVTNTFKGETSLLSRMGRVLAAYKLIHEYKDQCIDGIQAVGEIDAYMSTARLYKEGEGRANSWCFPVYKEYAEAPSLEIKDFWNPFLDPACAVSNSVSLGCNDNPRMIIISGPNAGGKSTTMKGVIISLILAQSLGIAPARSLVVTPVSKIMTYLNITDDIAAGNSYFKAGVKRAQELVVMADGLYTNEFAFVAADEVFEGTTDDEGKAAAYAFIDAIGRNPHVIGATATHFPIVTNLEAETQGRYFKNYKVSVCIPENGPLSYPFKLEPGISDQNVAFDILRQEGFDTAFLNKACACIATSKNRKTLKHDQLS